MSRLATAPRLIAAILSVGLALSACSSSEPDEEAQAEAVAEATRIEPVDRVLNVEIGRTRNGYVIHAVGLAPGLGYTEPALRARRDGFPGTDGFVDYDMVAKAPDPGRNLGQGTARARQVQTGLPISAEDLHGASGIRVHGLAGGVQMAF